MAGNPGKTLYCWPVQAEEDCAKPPAARKAPAPNMVARMINGAVASEEEGRLNVDWNGKGDRRRRRGGARRTQIYTQYSKTLARSRPYYLEPRAKVLHLHP